MWNFAVAFPVSAGAEIWWLRRRGISSLSFGFNSVSDSKLSRSSVSSIHAGRKDASYPEAKYSELEPDSARLFHGKDTLQLVLEPEESDDESTTTPTKQRKIITPNMNAALSNKVDILEVIKYPLRSESAVKAMTEKNTLVFIVDVRANKNDIKEAAKKLLEVTVMKVNTLLLPDGKKKKAYIALAPECNAIALAKKFRIL